MAPPVITKSQGSRVREAVCCFVCLDSYSRCFLTGRACTRFVELARVVDGENEKQEVKGREVEGGRDPHAAGTTRCLSGVDTLSARLVVSHLRGVYPFQMLKMTGGSGEAYCLPARCHQLQQAIFMSATLVGICSHICQNVSKKSSFLTACYFYLHSPS